MISRENPAEHLTQEFIYNSEDKLIEAKVEGLKSCSTTIYHYDALGRRTQKSIKSFDKYQQKPTSQTVTFFWQSMRLSGEVNSQNPTLKTHYIYNELSYEPIARITSDEKLNQCEVQYFHTLLNTPTNRVN